MKPIKVGSHSISYLGSNFQEWFGGMVVLIGLPVTSKKLPRSMNDAEITAELKPEPVTLGDMLATLKKMEHDVWAIFYIKDKNGVLRAVGVFWDGDGWGVDAFSVEDTRRWSVGRRVFSRNFGTPEPLESPRPSDTLTCPHCARELKITLS